jgi:transaldolase
MKLFLDSANLDHVREIHSWGIISGVTTNPSLIAREGGNFVETVYKIAEIVQGPTSAEVIAQDVDGMVKEGRALARVHEHIVVKLPLTEAGISACRILSDEGIKTNVTLCFQGSQALYAALAGATYISPFMGRVDDIAWDGTALIEEIADIYGQSQGIQTQVLAASLRHPLHLVQAARAGADVATVPYKVLKASIKHPLTDIGNKAFLEDWATVADKDIIGQVDRFLAGK